MARGRKPQPCPSHDEVRRLAALDPRPAVLARKLGVGIKAARRWMGEVGIQLPPRKKMRPRGVTPRFLRVAIINGHKTWTKLYGVWGSMRKRCTCPTVKDYPRYGARGITVCKAWLDSYDAFRAWAVSSGYRKGLTLDRVDSNGNYTPENCRWIPKGAQQANVRSAILLTLEGETHSLYTWARIVNLPADILRSRHYLGWTAEQVLRTPKLTNGNYRPGVQHKPRGRAAAKAKRLAQMPSEDSK